MPDTLGHVREGGGRREEGGEASHDESGAEATSVGRGGVIFVQL